MTKENQEFEQVESPDTAMPSMNLSVPNKEEEEEGDVSKLVSDDQLLGVYDEILNKIKSDRTQLDEVLDAFINMVINEGDSTTSSKEAVVNLIKIKSDQSDKMAKVADLMTRIKLKERDTFPRYLNAHQNNTININDQGQKRALLQALNKAEKAKNKKGR